jgi:hypothetical protein
MNAVYSLEFLSLVLSGASFEDCSGESRLESVTSIEATDSPNGGDLSARQLRNHRNGVVLFYVIAVVSAVVEGVGVRAIRYLAALAGVPNAGPMIAWAVFVVVGSVLGLMELHLVASEASMRNPILRACCWAQARLGLAGFLLNAALLGGAPGTAVALRRTNSSQPVPLTIIAAAIFASVWVPLYILVWP